MYSYDRLEKFSKSVFSTIGCSTDDAALATKVLLSADFRGIESHGIARLSGYVRLWEKGRINAKPDLSIVHESPSTAVVDGDSGLGLVVGPWAMKVALEKARQAGTGWVAVRNSNHFGIAGYHAMMAVEEDMIGITMTNASPLVAPTFSSERLLGTNPIAVAIPAGSEPPFVADMATTTAANGKLEVLMRQGKSAPSGWIQDKEGKLTTNASGVQEGGALRPLGGTREMGSHKGYALGAIVDIFSGVLSGANFGPWVPPFVSFLQPDENPVGKGLGHFFGAMRIDAFQSADDFKQQMDLWIQRFRSSNTTEGHDQVLVPGDPERIMEHKLKETGVVLNLSVEEDLQKLSESLGIDSL